MKIHPMKTRHYYQLYANDYDGSGWRLMWSDQTSEECFRRMGELKESGELRKNAVFRIDEILESTSVYYEGR